VSICRICDNARANRAFVVREMMFGTREPFTYQECGSCGCLQIVDVPTDLSRFYPPAYYSLGEDQAGGIIRTLKRARLAHAGGRRSLGGALLVRCFGVPPDIRAMLRSGARPSHSILDVGCGGGRLVRDLSAAGFERVTGIDPYRAGDEVTEGGAVLLRTTLDDVPGSYDRILMNHVFEHLPDPGGTLRAAGARLSRGGVIVIRIPLADSEAYRTYGPDWVQLDAPRHIFLHTRASMERLAVASGFRIRSIDHDSTGFQFWGSEQYRQDIPLNDGAHRPDRPRPGTFTARQLRTFESAARKLNRDGKGDQAAFLLERR
jgi:SAM-dependent methyltransferase